MHWRERTDIWFGLALVRPREVDGVYGGAYVSFVVIDQSLPSAVMKLDGVIADNGWSLSSLESMKLAFDYISEEKIDPAFDAMAADAEKSGFVLGAFHTFPRYEQKPS